MGFGLVAKMINVTEFGAEGAFLPADTNGNIPESGDELNNFDFHQNLMEKFNDNPLAWDEFVMACVSAVNSARNGFRRGYY